jgi:hypothetical protein
MEAIISGEVISMTSLLTTRSAVAFQAPRIEGMEMAPGAICRVWYGNRLGVPQSFRDIGNFYAAANFAALIVADRIEVVREPLTPAVAVEERPIATEEPPAAP